MTLKTHAATIFAHVDGGQSGRSSMRRPRIEDPIGVGVTYIETNSIYGPNYSMSCEVLIQNELT